MGFKCLHFHCTFDTASKGWGGSHRAAVAAVLHVDPVVVLVPEALHAEVGLVAEGVAFAGQGVYEEVVEDLSFPSQDQHPTVEPLALQGVRGGPLQFLGKSNRQRPCTTKGSGKCVVLGKGTMNQKSLIPSFMVHTCQCKMMLYIYIYIYI